KASDCISTFTIEQFKLDTIPSEKMSLESGFIFGCDICQDVCPWNQRVDRSSNVKDLKFENENQIKILNFFLRKKTTQLAQSLQGLSEGAFKRFFLNSSFERSGKRGLYKNLVFYLKELKIFT
ncbi:MAG: hypothetical protein Q7U04_04670, partial [Bacteriovorax sp.]|nr:hypothetical protein [Bacteriovorax sp.]